MQYEHPALFPLSDVQTDGYAQPEPRADDIDIDDAEPEAEAA